MPKQIGTAKSIVLDLILRSVIVLSLSAQLVYAGPIEDCQEYAKYGVPGMAGDILCRKGYLVAHDPEFKTPIWVVERLTSQRVAGTLGREDRFQPDPDLPKGRRAELSDYKGSGYDRGHMAPAADMRWDKQAMRESFYLSNIVPQDGPMNQGIWKALEERVRQWSLVKGEIYVYTGPIYIGEEEAENIGKNEVAVPPHLYKIVFDPAKVEAIAFIMPNRDLDVSDMGNYITTVREVEAQTGLDFLSALQKPVQDLIESQKSKSLW